MKKLLAGALCTFSLSLYAGDKVGNGGDVIVCPGEKTILLDLYQGKEDWGFEPLGRTGNRIEIIIDTLKNFDVIDPYIAQKFFARALQMEKEITLEEKDKTYRSKLVKLTKNKLVNISDEGVAELPADCEIVQAATQIQSPFPGEVKFTFQESIWNSLEADVQASLILHEVIYEHMISVKEEFSRSTRYYNAALHSGQFETVKSYFDVSSLFAFRNLAITDIGETRVFGAKRQCSVYRLRSRQRGDELIDATTVRVGAANVITNKNFSETLDVFWKKYTSQNACD